jgi:hypothetical protein
LQNCNEAGALRSPECGALSIFAIQRAFRLSGFEDPDTFINVRFCKADIKRTQIKRTRTIQARLATPDLPQCVGLFAELPD